ncbi:choice-of-anchor Q domain-containing protein [uncultured Thiohalocapsa sp.]|uniref:choice-of-anchor Q domain-containing protein n=1 Tax=uncultured Thiohalocapsa sp. TaxID=768990 RepID=UPI0025CBDFE3|nr:choice-of-anchor Q domain-containing protein [uncultured Thiohalocapsa sp.]
MSRPILVPAALIGALWLSVTPLSSQAEVFCVDTAAGLQTALSTAAINGEDDEVRIVQGTYVGNFVYASAESFDVAVKGGWDSSCTDQEIDPSNTVLDGNQVSTVLALSTPGATANFLVQGLTLRNGDRGNSGGGLFVKGDRSGSLTAEFNRIIGNTAGEDGGGVYSIFIAIASFTNNHIESNVSGHSGGGVYVGSDTLAFTNNRIESNVSDLSGGGVYAFGEMLSFTNNIVEGNTNVFFGRGGGIYTFGDTIQFTNNTVMSNAANYTGGGIHIGRFNADNSAKLYNNIFWNNAADEAGDIYIENDADDDFFPSPVVLSHNNFNQMPGSGYETDLPIIIDPSNLDAVDPMFVDPDNGDLSLLPDSPMINAGDPETPDLPATDIIGNPRVFGGVVDIGAYEWRDAPVLDGECFLDWAESQYPRRFAPAGAETVDRSPLFYRVYRQSRTALGYNENTARVYYRNREGETRNMGALETWLERAGCLTQ